MFLKKKAQIGIFIVIGIILILGSVLLLGSTSIFQSPSTEEFQGSQQQANLLNNYVEGCMDQGLEKSILFLGFQGGYYEYKKHTVAEGVFSIPVYIEKGKETFYPEYTDISEEINKIFPAYFIDCLYSTKNAIPQGYNISFDSQDFEGKGEFNQNTFSYRVLLPVSVSSEKSFRTFSQFELEKDFPYELYLTPVEIILQDISEEPLEIPITLLNRLSQEYNFRYEILENGPLLIYTFIFNENKENEYVHAFAVGEEL